MPTYKTVCTVNDIPPGKPFKLAGKDGEKEYTRLLALGAIVEDDDKKAAAAPTAEEIAAAEAKAKEEAEAKAKLTA